MKCRKAEGLVCTQWTNRGLAIKLVQKKQPPIHFKLCFPMTCIFKNQINKGSERKPDATLQNAANDSDAFWENDLIVCDKRCGISFGPFLQANKDIFTLN